MTGGFTLIELIVVIGLIVLIAALTLPRLANSGASTGSFAVALTSYLNTAGQYASGHETQVCIRKEGDMITTIPQTQDPLAIPTGLTVRMASYCYDPSGKVGFGLTVSVQDQTNGLSNVKVDEGYGNARVE